MSHNIEVVNNNNQRTYDTVNLQKANPCVGGVLAVHHAVLIRRGDNLEADTT